MYRLARKPNLFKLFSSIFIALFAEVSKFWLPSIFSGD